MAVWEKAFASPLHMLGLEVSFRQSGRSPRKLMEGLPFGRPLPIGQCQCL